MTPRSRFREALVVVITTAAAWAILIALVNPRGDFPMMDDWISAWLPLRRAAILALERGGRISSSSRIAAPILAATRRSR